MLQGYGSCLQNHSSYPLMKTPLLRPDDLLRHAAESLRLNRPPHVDLHLDCQSEVWPVQGDRDALVDTLVVPARMLMRRMSRQGRLTIQMHNHIVDRSSSSRYEEVVPGSYVEVIFTATPAASSMAYLVTSLNRTVAPEGCTFMVHIGSGDAEELVCLWPTVQPAAPSTETTDTRGLGECVLLIDDEPSLLHLLSQTLRRAGYRVLEASNSAVALAVLKQHASEIDLIITDIMMPGTTGYDILRHVAAHAAEIKTLVISGLVSPEAFARAHAGGADAFLAKPFQLSDLLDTLRTLLGKPGRLKKASNKCGFGFFEEFEKQKDL